MHFGDDAGVDAGSPEFETAAREAGKQLHVFGVRRARSGDAARGQVSLIVECAGIAEIAWQLQLDGKAEAFAVVEEAHLSRSRCVDSEAHAGMDGNSCACVGYDFFGRHIEALFEFIGSCIAESAFAGDVPRHFYFRAVCEGVKAGIEHARRASQLDVKSSGQKERTQSQACPEPFSAADKIHTRA